MLNPHTYTGASVWIPDPDAVWVSAQLLNDYKPGEKQLSLQLPNGNVRHTKVSPSDLPPLGNPDILEGENDLTALSFLHEPAVLHNLRVRFLDYNSIYTYCGIVLVAINPYDHLPIYGEEVIDAYSGQDMTDMEPHIFSVAEDAYRTMTREEKNQSIIISGESGSGKTVSAKFTMRYFAVVGGASQQTSVEERVLASNPIMESIGNAKTTRNDNSSRFGKYIEIGFGKNGDIIGANMRTYLLEKSRVVFQASAERNYHIFYQLCASRDLPEMRSLKLGEASFRYTNQGGDMQIPGTDDVADLERTRNAFTILGVKADQQLELFRIISAILHLGNVNIQASGRSSDKSYIDDISLTNFSKLLGVEGSQMAHWLCHRRLTVGGEMLVKPMTGQQAVEARDALAKHIYGQLFTWTVERLNSALRSQRGQAKSFIGVLDIYGFETFERNSFEQFCINYANEKLQQQFNRHVFHLEQEEYIREELAWSRIEFSDNQQCINLIEGQLGMFDLLDEECRMPKGSDENWVRKLYDQHLTSVPHPHFRKPRMSTSAFIVLHFADTVQYESEGFLDKNRDTVFEELINILKASQVEYMCANYHKYQISQSAEDVIDSYLCGLQSELVAELFQQLGNTPSVANGSVRSGKRTTREHKLTVGCQFRQSLQMLMDTLNSTTPHYVRCIKPNDLKEPFMFDPKRTVQQLRACGVLETIRISAAGYPSRWTYEEFFSRYHVLLHGTQRVDQAPALCRKALPHLITDPDQYCFGKTKVFFRAGQVALLEKLRAERLHVAAVIVQSRIRGWLARIRYTKVLWATVTLQRYSRGTLARRLALTLRYTKAALVIQKTFRMAIVRQLFLMIRQLLSEKAAVLLQARVRGWLARQAYRRLRAAVVFMQCCVRRKAARRELLQLKTEARSVERYRELNKGMEVKLMQLQLRADQEVEREMKSAEVEALRVTIQKLERQKQEKPQPHPAISEKEVEERRRAEEKAAQEILQLTQVQSVNQAVSREIADLQAELDEERRKYQGLLREFTRLEQRYDNLREMSLLTERNKGHKRTDSSQSLSFEPISPSPTPLSPQSPTPQSLSPFPSSFPSPELVRRVSVTSPPLERGFSSWSLESSSMVSKSLETRYKDSKGKKKPLFLENQLRSQRSQWEEEMEALRCQLSQAISVNFHYNKLQQTNLTALDHSAIADCVFHASDIRADSALSLPPGLPTNVLFLCIRHIDCSGDQARARSIHTMSLLWIKIHKWKKDSSFLFCFLFFVFCSLNICPYFQSFDSDDLVPLMADLSDLIRNLSDLSIQAYQQLLRITGTHETIPSLPGSGAKLGMSRKRAGSEPRPTAADTPTMMAVLRELGALHMAMTHQAFHATLLEQAFRQLTHYICAASLNSMLLRKDMCCLSRGLQIRYNVTLLEDWLRGRGLQAGGAVAALEPLIQAAQLLQMGKKTADNAQAIVQTCAALSSQQIVKILTLYTPHCDLDEKVTINFIRTIQSDSQPRQLLMDVRREFPVIFPHVPPPVLSAEQLVIPESLKISFLRRV
uniref:Methyl-CpG binding domain protein 3b n=1 Tax=Salarias fasciatus TaxID=181472 RepID=A0A672IWT3_SALFA